MGTVKPTTSGATQRSPAAHQRGKLDTSFPCSMCHSSGHFIVACPKFKELLPVERKDVVLKERLCFNCLGLHSVRNCRSSVKCKLFGKSHHTMMHSDEDTAKHQDLVKVSPTQSSTKVLLILKSPHCSPQPLLKSAHPMVIIQSECSSILVQKSHLFLRK